MSTPPAPALAGRTYRTVRRARDGLHVSHCRCHAGAHDRAVDEEHQRFSITLVERGSFTYRTHAGSLVLRPGWLMLGNPGQGYACSHENSDGSGDDCTTLSMSADVLDEVQAALGTRGTRERFDRAGLPPLPRIAAVLQRLAHQEGEGFALEETALDVLASVQRSLHDDAAPALAIKQHDRARAAADCIESRAGEELSLDDVANAAGLSPFHLLRVFRQSMGVTPHQYLMRVRLMRAATLLRDTKLPVTSVALEAGWADLANFNRAFRREMGCTPGAFRRDGPAQAAAR